jgi:glycosyltransferase involved in cell wall biosynthesis
MSDLRISVAMCTYNGSLYLGEQLRSIGAQDLPPTELVVCDDGSTDDTLRLLREFAAEAPFPVRVEVNEARLGPGRNFEKAIGICRGDIIVLSDQDDIWKPCKVKRLAAAFADHPDAVYAFSDADMVDDGAAPLGETLWEAVGLHEKLKSFSGRGQLEILLVREYITGATLGFRASFRNIVLPIPRGWMHDCWIALLGSTFSYGVPVDEPLLTYRLHDTQVCGLGKSLLDTIQVSLATGESDWRAKLESFQQLENRIASVSSIARCPADRFEPIRQKALHLSSRARIRSSAGSTRILRALAEARTGRYRRFSGWHSLVRDLWPG